MALPQSNEFHSQRRFIYDSYECIIKCQLTINHRLLMKKYKWHYKCAGENYFLRFFRLLAACVGNCKGWPCLYVYAACGRHEVSNYCLYRPIHTLNTTEASLLASVSNKRHKAISKFVHRRIN